MEGTEAKRRKLEGDDIDLKILGACNESDPIDVEFTGEVTVKQKGEFVSQNDSNAYYNTEPKPIIKSATDLNRPIQEKDVGITEYMSLYKTTSNISGVLKQRYSDFLVSERSVDGSLVVLSSCELPKEEYTDSFNGSEKNAPSEYASLASEFKDIIQESEYNKIVSLSANKEIVEPVLLTAQDSKDDRRKLHKLIRENFSNLESDTIEEKTGTKSIRVFKKDKRPSYRKNNFKSYSWPENLPKYCHFTLFKENMDTMDAVNLMSRFLHVRPSLFTYAGTKDRRAVTVQRICTYMIRASRLQNLNKRLRNCFLGNFEYCDSPLKLGDLSGNHFSIVLRNVQGIPSDINQSMEEFSRNGFINYFGMQRFGTGCVPTHHIGKALMCSQWEKAVSLILKPRLDGNDSQQEAKDCWSKTKSPQKSYELLTNKRCIEGHLLEGLMKFGRENYLNSLQQIPRNTRLMYVHAFQSFIWNIIVSRRIKECGINVIEGDLVFRKQSDTTSKEIGVTVLNSEDDMDKVDKEMVKKVNAGDLASGEYSIFDVVMPLPGYDVEYPGSTIKEWYRELMAQDGIDIDNMRHKVKDFSVSGAYRHIAVKPKHLSWSIHQYDDHTVPMFQNDLERMQGKKWERPASTGEKKALCLEFTLPSSTYATMAIREITRTDSSPHMQAKLSAEL